MLLLVLMLLLELILLLLLLLLADAVRVQRSPQKGLLNDDAFEDYSDDPEGRHLHKRKHKRKYHGGFGCNRKHGCGG